MIIMGKPQAAIPGQPQAAIVPNTAIVPMGNSSRAMPRCPSDASEDAEADAAEARAEAAEAKAEAAEAEADAAEAAAEAAAPAAAAEPAAAAAAAKPQGQWLNRVFLAEPRRQANPKKRPHRYDKGAPVVAAYLGQPQAAELEPGQPQAAEVMFTVPENEAAAAAAAEPAAAPAAPAAAAEPTPPATSAAAAASADAAAEPQPSDAIVLDELE